MKAEKVLFIYNPTAGKGTLRNKISDVIDLMMEKQFDVTIVATQKEMDAANVIRDRGEEFQRVICAGGDGTLHEVTHGLMALPEAKRPTCGYIPTGTVNDFANGIKLPRRVVPAARIAVGEQCQAFDVGEMNGSYFSYVTAFGAFTSVSYETPQATKTLFGKTAYILDGASKLNTIKNNHVFITTDEEAWEEDCILGMVSNAETVAGLRLYKKNTVRLDDGLLDAIFVRTPKNPIELNQVMAFLLTGKPNSQVKIIHSAHVSIESEEEIAYTLDGENGGGHKKAVITDHKQAITFYHGLALDHSRIMI